MKKNCGCRLQIFMMAVLLISAGPHNLRAAEDEIIWMISQNWPPTEYLENGKAKGVDVELVNLIMSALPQYKYSFSAMNFARKEAEFKAGNNVCIFSYYKKPEREKFVYYSIPSFYFFPNVIIMRNETHKKLGFPASISLSNLIKNRTLKLGIRAGRSYGAKVDRILNEHKNNENIYISFHTDETRDMIRMLQAGRFDYMIEYPDEADYMARKIGVTSLAGITIEEQADLVWTCTACSKTQWGLKVIKDINRAVLKLRTTREYRQIYERMINIKLIPLYEKSYDEKFLKY